MIEFVSVCVCFWANIANVVAVFRCRLLISFAPRPSLIALSSCSSQSCMFYSLWHA